MRLFVAIFPPAEAGWDLRRCLLAAGRRVRLTPIERWHVTLAFLGEVAEEQQPEIERALDQVSVPKGIELRLRGGGRFGKVLWAGVDGDLGRLHSNVCAALDLPDRDFVPHLTVAYRDDPGLRAALEGYAGPAWALDETALVRSVPGEGYTTLRTW